MPRLEQILRPTQRLRHHLDPTASLPAAPRHCDNATATTPLRQRQSGHTKASRPSQFSQNPDLPAEPISA